MKWSVAFPLFILCVFLSAFILGAIASALGASLTAILATGAVIGFGLGIVFARTNHEKEI
jgi:hypothetical protein